MERYFAFEVALEEEEIHLEWMIKKQRRKHMVKLMRVRNEQIVENSW